MIKSINVYDFDGTVVDSSHRYRTAECGNRIDLEYWIENECRTMEDSLLPLADQFKSDCENPEVYVIVATARIWCDLTVAFCERENLMPQLVVARQDRNDKRGGADLKIEGINKFLENSGLGQVEMNVFEDNVDYMKSLCDYFKAVGHYYPSKQGH